MLFLSSVTPRWRWLVWTGYVLIWTTLLVVPFPGVEEWPLFDPPLTGKRLIGKTVHGFAYAIMAILTGWLPLRFPSRLLLLFFLMIHAAATEWIQLRLANRSGLIDDVVLDHLGILAGLLLSWKWWTRAE